MEVAVPPMGYVVVQSESGSRNLPVDLGLTDITYFSMFGYQDECDIGLRLRQLETFTPWPLDYRPAVQVATEALTAAEERLAKSSAPDGQYLVDVRLTPPSDYLMLLYSGTADRERVSRLVFDSVEQAESAARGLSGVWSVLAEGPRDDFRGHRYYVISGSDIVVLRDFCKREFLAVRTVNPPVGG
jgi:hypothetical protein